MKLRRLLLYVHLIAGLVSALVLILLGVTGAIMVFETEIDYALNAKLYRLDHRYALTHWTLGEMVAQVEKAQSAKVVSLRLPDEPDVAPTLTLRMADGKMRSVTVDPVTSKVIGDTSSANTFTQKLHQFHKNLLLGDKGKLVTGWGAILLVLLALTGIILWWPRKILAFSSSHSGARINFDLHNVLGFYSSFFMLIFGITGVVIHWDDEAMKLVGNITHTTATQAMPSVELSAPSTKPLAAQFAYEIACDSVPGAWVTSIQNLGSLRGPVRVTMRFPEDRTPAGRTNVYLHPVTGEVLSAQTSRDAPPAYKIVKVWNRQLHTGDAWGWPSRIIACLASLSLPLLALTGPLIWWGRIRRKKSAVSSGPA